MIAAAGPDVLIRVKAVPGASREQIVGPLGESNGQRGAGAKGQRGGWAALPPGYSSGGR